MVFQENSSQEMFQIQDAICRIRGNNEYRLINLLLSKSNKLVLFYFIY